MDNGSQRGHAAFPDMEAKRPDGDVPEEDIEELLDVSYTIDCKPELEEDIEELLDVKYVASKLKVCTATVYKMVREGKIEAVHLNRLVRITPKGYKQLIEKRSRKGL